ncbi:hypothetical protein HDV00_007347 [Rhizophlyctis rosea]|nr:hypothetical protein HDV00_007347 [Rhizophlyctis rosea]
MFVAASAEALINGQLYWAGRRSSLRVRAVLVEEIYRKAERRSAGFKPPSSSSSPNTSSSSSSPTSDSASLGKIVTLMSVDTERLQSFVSYAHRLVLELPISIVLAVGGLFYVLGWSAMVGLGVLCLGTVGGGWVGSRIGKVQEVVMASTDSRVNIVNEVLQGIRIIKYFAWEPQFIERIVEARKKELAALRRLWTAYVGFNFSATFSSLLVAFATFAFYTSVAGHVLDPKTAFTSIALLNQISTMIAFLPYHITEFFQAKVSFERIVKFLGEPELEKYRNIDVDEGTEVIPGGGKEDGVVGFKGATFGYFGDEADGGGGGEGGDVNGGVKFKLRDVSLEFVKGGLNVVCGPTGAGKSSLVLALLGGEI